MVTPSRVTALMRTTREHVACNQYIIIIILGCEFNNNLKKTQVVAYDSFMWFNSPKRCTFWIQLTTKVIHLCDDRAPCVTVFNTMFGVKVTSLLPLGSLY